MAENPDLWVRVSTPAGHFTVPRDVADAADSSWRVLKQDALDQFGHLVAPKLREDIPAATPATNKPAPSAGDTPKEK